MTKHFYNTKSRRLSAVTKFFAVMVAGVILFANTSTGQAYAAAAPIWENTVVTKYSKSLKVKFCSSKKPTTKTLKPGKKTTRDVCKYWIKPYYNYYVVYATQPPENYTYCPKKKGDNIKPKWRKVGRHTHNTIFNEEGWATVVVKYYPQGCA